jgi:FdrA protein
MMTDQKKLPYQLLLAQNVKVVNVGLEGFVKDLRDCDIDVVHVDWRPSAGGDPEMAALLAKLGV